MATHELSVLERARLGDDLHQHRSQPHRVGIDPTDGLPRPTTTTTMQGALAPPLTRDNLVCMADERRFVVRDRWGQVVLAFPPSVVRRDAQGRPFVRRDHLSAEDESLLDPHLVKSLDSHHDSWCPVEPERPVCAYYKRVLYPFESGMKEQRVERVCTAQRGDSGEYLSLNESEVRACEHRNPRDFVSEERLRRFDDRLLTRAEEQEEDWSPDETPTQSLRVK